MLVVIGLILTLAPVVYVALERAQMLKVAAVLLLFVVGAIFAVGAAAWADLPQVVTAAADPGRRARLRRCCSARWPSPAPAAGRTWCSPTGSGTRASAWARTCRGWSARSPASRRPRRAPATSSSRPRRTCARWRGWWKFANIEQLTTFVLITFLTILFTSLLAYSTVFGREGLANNIGFIKTEGEVLGRAGRVVVPVLLLGHRRVLAVRRGARASSTTPAGWPPTCSRPRYAPQRQREQDVRRAGLGPGR